MGGVDHAHHTPIAGQASVEYIAVIALVAALFAFALPAVGGPDLPRAVEQNVRLGICVVAGDICGPKSARAAGVAPCTLNSRTDGRAVGLSILSVDLGGNETLTVAPQSDGSVNVSVGAGVSAGGSAGLGEDLTEGPVAFSIGAGGSVGARFQAARGWSFPDRASAQRFLDALPHSVSSARFPPAWNSGDLNGDVSAGAGIYAGSEDSSADLAGLASSASGVLGVRRARDGTVTIYGRASFELVDASVPLLSSIGPGRHDYSIETSFVHGAARELVFRAAAPSERGNRVTDTVVHLDLRDPANLALARAMLQARTPAALSRAGSAVVQRARAAGVIERSVSDLNDVSYTASGDIKLGLQFGGSYKRIKVRKNLVHASAWVNGSGELDRYDCEHPVSAGG